MAKDTVDFRLLSVQWSKSPRMNSLAQNIFVFALCAMATFGHVPAWLHVAECAHEASEVQSSGCCSCSHDQPDFETGAGETGEDGEQTTEQEHDSDSCTTCQTLATSADVDWQLDPPAEAEICLGETQAIPSNEIDANYLAIPQPRAPPEVTANCLPSAVETPA